MNLSALTLRPLEERDWPAVAAAYAHSFLDVRPPAVWDWRFQQQTGAAGSAWSGMVAATADGHVAAFVGASHHRGWVHGREMPIRLARDNFSHPRWRALTSGRRGLFLQTEAAYLAACAEAGALCLGIGLDRRVRLGNLAGLHQRHQSGHWLRCPLTPGSDTPASGSSVLLEPTDFSDSAAWDAAWEARRPRQRAGLIRDAAFLRWRFDARQGRQYWCFALQHWQQSEPLGHLVFTAAGPASPTRAVLVDAHLPPSPGIARDAWAQASRWLYRQGLHEVITYTTPACPEHLLWAGLGFLPLAAPLPVAGVFLPTPQLPAAAFESDYAFTLADSDLY